jgi:hypothetical protein
MTDQRELVFHNTVPLDEQDLPKAREIAEKQNEIILSFFERNKDRNFTPAEVYDELNENYLTWGTLILLSSVRRSITNLTKRQGRLIKCQWDERRKGKYGKDNRTWRYNTEYLSPLNPRR